jgi:hypothetical protein
VVEVDVERRHRGVRARGACQLAVELLLDGRPVRQPGERIVVDEVREPLLGFVSRGDVDRDADDRAVVIALTRVIARSAWGLNVPLPRRCLA